MKFEDYKRTIIDKMILETPNYLKQKLINEIRTKNIGNYGTKDPNILELGHMTKEQKINLCVTKNNKTLQLIDLLEIHKGYKYTILFKYNNLDLENFIKNLEREAKDISGDYYKQYPEDVKEDDVMFYEDDENIFIKFHKMIDVIDKNALVKKYIRYPILFVFHKDINILECRFDKLSYNANYSFYFITMQARFSRLQRFGEFEYGYLNLESIIKYMVENKKDFIKEIIWSFEAAKSKGLTLKVGEDGIMPFIGELEIILEKLKKENEENEDIIECLGTIDEYLESTKRFANEKFRILSLMKYEDKSGIITLEESIDFKILFDYSGNDFDLLNIYENEINDMERINYVIKFIGKIAKDIGEL